MTPLGDRGLDRPWQPSERVAIWYDLFDPAGKRLGMVFGADRVSAWVARKPGVWWSVVLWYGGEIEARYLVRAKVRRKRGAPRVVVWKRVEAKKGGST